MKKIKTKKGRIFSIILALSMVFSFYVSYMPLEMVSAEVPAENFSLTWNNNSNEMTVDTQGNTKSVSVTAHIYYHASGTFSENDIQITIPKSLQWGRDGQKAQLSSTFLSNLPASLEWREEGENVIILNSANVSAPTYNIFPVYSIDAMDVKSGSENSLTVSFSSPQNEYQSALNGSETIKCKVKTQVNSITTNKKKVSQDNDASGLLTQNGVLRLWKEDANTYYGYTQEQFNSDKENYNVVEYQSEIKTEGNQPYKISIEDTPENSGIVIGAYASGIVTGKMTKSGDKYVLDQIADEYTNNDSKQYVNILVKYPKSYTKVKNKITAYATGIDDNKFVNASAWSGEDEVKSDALYEGDVWGIRKHGISENGSDGLTFLENGYDKNISFWIYPAIAHTYNYGQFENGQFVDKNNGPYKVETTDDVMYLSSGAEGVTKRLGKDDYEFTSVVPYVMDKKIAEGGSADGLPNLETKPLDERPEVEVYSRTEVNGQWHKDGVAKTTSFTTTYNGEVYNKYSEVQVQQGAIQVKVSYNGSWGDTLILAQVYGKIKADGANVKAVVNDAKNNDMDKISLINWANIQGFDKNGKWLNVTSEENITNSSNIPSVKEDLLKFDEENYEGHSVSEDKQSQRATAISQLNKSYLYTGAADNVTVTDKTDSKEVKYDLFALMTANSRTTGDMEKALENKVLYNSKKVVFYDLLPKGVEFSKTAKTGNLVKVNDKNYNDQTSKSYKPQGTVNLKFPPTSDKNFTYYDKTKINELRTNSNPSPEVTSEVFDNYKGTGRQLVKMTLEYSSVPTGYVGGTAYKIYGNVYKTTLVATTTDAMLSSSQSDLQHDNLFAAQFYNEDGETICNLENYNNSNPNDGSYYGGYQNVFSGLGGANTSDKTVVYAPAYFEYQPSASQTGINLAIKADDYDYGFKQSTSTLCGKNYTYRLSYYQDVKTTVEAVRKDLVLFDTIETVEGTKWKGTLTGFDTTEADNLIRKYYPDYDGVTIYVNDNEVTDADYQTQGKVTADTLRANENGWRVYHSGDDLSTVKSVAFLVGKDIEFKNGLSNFNVYVKMKAPDKIENTSWKAYNNMAYYSEIIGGDKSTNVGEKVEINLKNLVVYSPVKVIKEFTGDSRPVEKEFTFTIKADKYVGDATEITAETMPLPSETTITVNSASNWTNVFGSITYYKEGDYYYTVTENNPGTEDYNGYTFDTTVHKVKVHVYGPDQKGKTVSLSKAVYLDDSEEPASPAQITFTNNYKPTKTYFELPVEKTVTGDPTPEDKEFRFVITGEENAPLPAETEIKINGSSNSKFGRIEFTKAGTYTYNISEKNMSYSGYTFDTTVYKAVVTVTDNNSVLNADYKIYKDNEQVNSVKFENKYSVTGTDFVFPTVTKKIQGEKVPEGTEKTFDFEITAQEGTPMPEKTTVQITGEGSADFGKIHYTKAGTYTYTVKEIAGNDKGYTYDTAEYKVIVTVTDNNSKLIAESKIKINEEDKENISFTNGYTVEKCNFEFPEVEKKINGSVAEGQEKTFTFKLTAQEGASMPENSEIIITGSGKASFGTIEFTKAGTYTYKVSEISGTDSGYTYDNSEYTVTVNVTDEDSVLKATSTISKGEETVQEIVFTNDYATTSAQFTFPAVIKKIQGNVEQGEEKTFTFNLTAEDENAPLPEKTEVTITGEGSAEFGKTEYTKAGVYIYRITEKNSGEENYTYDNSEYTLTVTVKDDNSVLKAECVITKNGEPAQSVEFVNSYSPKAPVNPGTPEPPENPENPGTPEPPENPETPDSSSSDEPDSSEPDTTAGGNNDGDDSDDTDADTDSDDDDDSDSDEKPEESSGKDKDGDSSKPTSEGGDNADTGAKAVPGVILTAVLAALCINRRRKFDDGENKDEK